MIKIQLLELLNLPMILFIGIITSVQDMKDRKIRNKWVILGLIYSFLTFIFMLIYMKNKNLPLNINYLRIYFVNLFISLIIGFMLWMINLWTAGDAKIFLTYSALIPLSVYKLGKIGFFPSYILLINTFTLAFVYFSIRIILKLDFKTLIQELKKTFNPNLIFSFIVFIFGFNFLTTWFFNLLRIPSNFVTTGFFILIMMLFIKNVLKISLTFIGSVLSVFQIIFNYSSVFTRSFLIRFGLQVFFFLFLRYFILNLGFSAFSKYIYIEDLEEGMSLAENILKEGDNYKKEREISISFIQSIFDVIEKEPRSILENKTKLTQKDIILIKKLHSRGKLSEHQILVFEKIHFALFIFIGVLLTLLSKGNFLIYLKFELFSKPFLTNLFNSLKDFIINLF